jgi:hypothetical protein
MQDVEIESLLQEAGYTFNPASRLYETGQGEDAAEQDSETVADILEIPLDDLQRWEAEQQEVDRTAT